MPRAAASAARRPFCHVRSLLSRAPSLSAAAQWQQTRSLRQDQRRRPSRMILSTEVARAPSGPPSAIDKTRQRKRGEPFGHLNQTKVPPSLLARQQTRQPPLPRTRDPPKIPSNRVRKKESGRPKKRELFHAMKMQQSLSEVSYGERAKVKAALSDVKSFDEFPLLPIIKSSIGPQALPGMVNITPTLIQKIAIPALLSLADQKGKKFERRTHNVAEQFLIAAETGSGKTLSYLLPVIDAMKRNEAVANELIAAEAKEKKAKEKTARMRPASDIEIPAAAIPSNDVARPRVIILLPTHELVAQVGALAKSFSHTVKYRASPVSSQRTASYIKDRLFSQSGIDVLVSTPHLLKYFAEEMPYIFSRVTHLVIDEADSLFDRSFAPLTEMIIARCNPSLQQLILCSATIPSSLSHYLDKHYPSMKRLVSPNLHAIPRRVQLSVVDIESDPYHGNRKLACADVIWKIAQAAPDSDATASEKASLDVKRIIVFVNAREKAVEVADFLVSKGIDAVAFSRDTEDSRRKQLLLADFNATTPKEIHEVSVHRNVLGYGYDQATVIEGKPKTPINAKVIVCTDLGSRGIDTVACRHVILYDVPYTSIDFIHRLGRTGRMGRRGRGIVLVGRYDRKDIVREFREAMFKGQAMI